MSNLLQSVMSMFQPTGGAQVIGPAGGQTQPQPPNNPSQVNNPGTPIPGSNPGNPAAPEIKEPVNPLDAIKLIPRSSRNLQVRLISRVLLLLSRLQRWLLADKMPLTPCWKL
jgi:hypothetical protein